MQLVGGKKKQEKNKKQNKNVSCVRFKGKAPIKNGACNLRRKKKKKNTLYNLKNGAYKL